MGVPVEPVGPLARKERQYSLFNGHNRLNRQRGNLILNDIIEPAFHACHDAVKNIFIPNSEFT